MQQELEQIVPALFIWKSHLRHTIRKSDSRTYFLHDITFDTKNLDHDAIQDRESLHDIVEK